MPIINGVESITGRCRACRIYYYWHTCKANPKLKDATCPSCRGQLKATTHLCKDKRVQLYH